MVSSFEDIFGLGATPSGAQEQLPDLDSFKWPSPARPKGKMRCRELSL